MSEAKGPYKALDEHRLEGPGFDKLPQKVFQDLDLVGLLNLAYAAGRTSRDGLREASQWALEFFKARDEMNAKVHCSPIRLSPITERFMKALEADVEVGK